MISNPILPTIPEPVASFGSPFHPRPDQISTVYAFTFASGYSMAKRTNYSAKLKISSRGLSTPTRNASPSSSQSLFFCWKANSKFYERSLSGSIVETAI